MANALLNFLTSQKLRGMGQRYSFISFPLIMITLHLGKVEFAVLIFVV